jgi:trimethylamine--corrinoid protein Co-methyltransferase
MYIPEAFAAAIRNTTKIQSSAYQLDSEVFNIAMAKAVGTELIGNCSMSPPMACSKDTVQSTFRTIEAGFPILVGGGVTMGATSPASLAGAVILLNAQTISGVVLTQLIKPRSRVIGSDFGLSQDMRTGNSTFGSIEGVLHVSAINQIWRRYGLPRSTSIAGSTSSKLIDVQCGYEKAVSAMGVACSGSNYVHMLGGVYGEVSWHPAQAVLDNDIAGMIGRYIKGIEVHDESLAIDLINAVGPIPGMYLDKAHTRKWWKRDWFLPRVGDRLNYPDWIAKGRKTALDYASERVEEILATHKPKLLTAGQDAEIEKILGEARVFYKAEGLI